MKQTINEMQKTSCIIRRDIITMIHAAGSGHPGGSLSAADILTTLYFNEMNIDPENPTMKNRDKFVLSKGHGAPVLYATLARRGYFPVEKLGELRQLGAMLQGHPDMKGTPGVEMSTGSLGQGISASVGMALAAKMDKSPTRIYTLLGDGELNEGLVWEAAMAAAHYNLGNLTAVLDYNGLQIDGANEKVMSITPVDKKFESFGWDVIKIDGHNFEEIISAFEKARETKDQPTIIIADTVKGKGVCFMEDDYGWHGKAPSDEEKDEAIASLGGDL